MSEPTHITVRGARVHNLQGVDVDLPRNSLVVFTGVSGSGKSSLAFDTIYKEGQRRFMESLSSYARQFLGQMERPRVELVEGVSPTISIDQKTTNRNPRSTVGTITEIYDHLRLLFARLGTPRCPVCHTAVSKQSVDQIVDDLIVRRAGQKVQVLGPLVRDRKGEYRKELADLRRDGFVRARIDGKVRRLDEDIVLARYEKHTIEVVLDRMVVRQGERPRLGEAIEAAVRMGEGVVTLLLDEGEVTLSTARACPNHPEINLPELEPRLFSFNAPQGACTTCNGLGQLEDFDLAQLIDDSKPGADCFNAFNEDDRLPFAHFSKDVLRRVLDLLGAPKRRKLADWGASDRQRLLFGDPTVEYSIEIVRGTRSETRERVWNGLVPMVRNVWRWTAYKGLERFRVTTPCPECQGTRLNPIARAVDFRGRGLPELSCESVADARTFFRALELQPSELEVGELLVQEIRERLNFLHDVGLGYLALDRSAATLSGGEAQRIRLAAQVGSALQGVTYVLDEPSIGLHPRDNARLLATLERLRDRGNSVLVVEHDAETIAAADYVIDVGPGAGREGGHITAAAPPAAFLTSDAPTAAWMRGDRVIDVPKKRRKGNGLAITVRGADRHNLQGIDASFPLGMLVVVTGVSGSGKSTLVFQVLERALMGELYPDSKRAEGPAGCRKVDGLHQIDKVIRISQTPIGRTPRSNPATYTGAFDLIRALFAKTPEARARGYKKGRFSFNVAGGRCAECDGAGVKTVEMQFLPSVEVECEVCAGRRFNPETLEITYKRATIHDVLQMSIADAAVFFAKVPKLARILDTMVEVGLGYVPLGQPSTTLSGGEAQRVKLATELHRPATGDTVYLLDEPTTGLHFADVAKLLEAIDRLVNLGNTVIVVEHHTDVIKRADHILDLGPEGGTGGGTIVGEGTPEHIATLDTPTGRALAALPQLGAPLMVAEAAERRLPVHTVARELIIEGARKHNLQGVDVRIPHNQMTVITGVSGSGKTSLAFDTIFSEGQRRYVESLSTYARRFLGRLDRAPVDRLEGLAPAIAIDQRNSSRNPRSTVATVTEIHDVLRLLWARIGHAFCPHCDQAIRGHSPSQAALELQEQATGAGWLTALLRPADQPAVRRDTLVRDGWSRLFHDGAEVELQSDEALPLLAAGVELVVDRVNPASAARSRLSEAVASAYLLGGRHARFRERKGDGEWLFTERPECSTHGAVLPAEITPKHFSFNSRLGACEACDGLGKARAVVPELLFPAAKKGFWDALDGRVGGTLSRSARNNALIDAVFARIGLKAKTPVSKWTPQQWDAMLDGLPEPFDIQWTKRWGRSVRNVDETRHWHGLLAILRSWSSKLEWLTAESVCRACKGGRLQPALQSIRIGGLGIHQFAALTVDRALATVRGWDIEGGRGEIAERPLLELDKRLAFLSDVGLGYIALDRSANTLSGGESQRIRLASQLGSGLCGVIYVLDEPTIGLHPRDTERLLDTLDGLRDLGNTLVLVEHDPETIRRADHVIDLGPGAGIEGGQLMAAGTVAAVTANAGSLTGRWLAGTERMPHRGERRKKRKTIDIKGARANNLAGVNVKVPTGCLVAVSGVSGSGKSSLVLDTLAPGLQQATGSDVLPAEVKSIKLGEGVDRVVIVDQSPIGRTPRSTPATYTKIMDQLRKVFATTLGAQERGWNAGRFTYNGKAGRCETCEGRGAILIEMHFLPDVWVECEACRGRRYNRDTLEVRWRGHSIADILGMRIDAVAHEFSNHRSLSKKLNALVDVGLGYLTLGQPATTLSGGEAQRVKLASELTSRQGHCVYILDEPTTGLHLSDVRRLVEVLHRLVDAGHSVIVIEHHVDVLLQADWIIDMGPHGGEGGGQIVAQGTPEQVAKKGTATGQALGHAWLEAARLGA